MALPFTLVTTVYNEATRLAQTLADLDAQTLPPAEVVIVDAGSTDGTGQMLEAWAAKAAYPVRVLVQPGCNIAQGRNYAIAKATHEQIVSTDFGCRYDPRWLATLVAPFMRDPSLQVVGGAFTILGEEVTTHAARADYILAAGYPPDTSGPFSVSSRSIAYKKEVWKALGGYQEWLTLAADDTIFWRQIKLAGYKYKLVDKPYVYWLRHKTFTAFGKESYRYGLGDGESEINRRNFYSILFEGLLRVTAGPLFAALALVYAPFMYSKIYQDYTHSNTSYGQIALLVGILLAVVLLLLYRICRFAFRPYRAAWRNYRALRRSTTTGPQLALADWLRACYLVEVNRIYYIRGNVRGWLLAPKRVRQGRAAFRKLYPALPA